MSVGYNMAKWWFIYIFLYSEGFNPISGERCLYLHAKDGIWGDDSCNGKRGFICKKSKMVMLHLFIYFLAASWWLMSIFGFSLAEKQWLARKRKLLWMRLKREKKAMSETCVCPADAIIGRADLLCATFVKKRFSTAISTRFYSAPVRILI